MSGTDELAAYLARVGASTSDVDAALIEHGREVTTVAQSLAPSRSGSLRQAITSTYTAGTLTVDAGTALRPHAYTMHAVKLGKSNGYMVMRVPSHTRRGSYVSPYKALRKIPDRPYLILAWERLLNKLTTRVTDALTDAIERGV